MASRAASVRDAGENWLDSGAIAMSLLCIVHCAGLPILLAMLPTLSTMFALPEAIHF